MGLFGSKKEKMSPEQIESDVNKAIRLLDTDERKAVKMLKKATNAGSKRGFAYLSYHNLVMSHMENNQRGMDIELSNLKKCYDDGCVEASYLTAEAYYYYYGDNDNGARWYKEGAEKGHISSMIGYGRCCLFGKGREESLSDAYMWFSKVPSNYSGENDRLYHECYGITLYRKNDYKGSIEQFKKIAPGDSEYSTACYYLGVSYNVLGDAVTAKRYLQKGIELGEESCKRYITYMDEETGMALQH